MPLTITIPSAAELLKRETYEQHREAEHYLVSYLQKIKSPPDYIRLLQSFYAFYHPLEQSIAGVLTQEDLPDLHRRRRAHLILSDLHALDAAITVFPFPATLPLLPSPAAAMGALYVLEGSSLGGSVISKQLLQHPQLRLAENHLHFFQGHGTDTGILWKAFLAVLQRYTGDTEILVATATETFTLFSAWLRQTLHHEPES